MRRPRTGWPTANRSHRPARSGSRRSRTRSEERTRRCGGPVRRPASTRPCSGRRRSRTRARTAGLEPAGASGRGGSGGLMRTTVRRAQVAPVRIRRAGAARRGGRVGGARRRLADRRDPHPAGLPLWQRARRRSGGGPVGAGLRGGAGGVLRPRRQGRSRVRPDRVPAAPRRAGARGAARRPRARRRGPPRWRGR